VTDDAQNMDRDPVTGSRSSASRAVPADVTAPVGPVPVAARPASGRARRRDRARRQERERKQLPIWQEMLVLLGMALVLAIVIKAFFMQAFYIPSGSMNDTLVLDDRILVQKVTYWAGEPQRGDIVVFSDPGGWLGPGEVRTADNPLARGLETFGLYPTGGHLVKRVIGVAGDTITCCDDQGRISVNGQPLDEDDYVADVKGVACNGPMTGNCEWSAGPVPEGHLFVMGDNRGMSADSSAPAHLCLENETDCTKNPYVDVDLVVGKVLAVVWPSDRLDWLNDPDSFDDVPEPE
jgi:signal peptidase I